MKRLWMLAAIAALGAGAANAQTLYKLIDKNGKVTYSESAPKPGEFDGQVIRIDVNPNQNTATLPRPPRREAVEQEQAQSAARAMGVKAAREKLEAAKKALALAQDNPSPEEVARVGTTKGFTRPVESEEYKAKLAKLEDDVKQAEEELKRAEAH